jgi:hypothetical protein
MSERLIAVCGAALLLLALAVVSSGQVQTTTVTKTQAVQNPMVRTPSSNILSAKKPLSR